MTTALWLPQTANTANIQDRVAKGDPELGWRGDPDMAVYEGEACEHDERGGCVAQVVAWDAHGEPYVAAHVHRAEHPSSWRDVLIRKLVDGDWQQGADHQKRRLNKAILEPMKRRQYEQQQKIGEFSEKLTGVLWDIWKPGTNSFNFDVRKKD